MSSNLDELRSEFATDPNLAFREWFREQDRLRLEGRVEDVIAAAENLHRLLPELVFDAEDARARFFHNFAVYLGSRGPAASLERALRLFDVPLAIWTPREHPDDLARAIHNRANALQNLGTTRGEISEAVDLYERALLYRTSEERAIARSVTLHNMGAALRRLAELAPYSRDELLSRSASVLEEAVAIREAEDLPEGKALSLFQLGLTLRAWAGSGEADERLPAAAQAFEESARAYDAIGKGDEAAVARRMAREAAEA
jgi:hypothetical protein